MKINQIAAQLYTVREYLKTPKDIAQSLGKIKDIGYQSIQVSGMGPIDENELIKMLQDMGLNCCATHEPSNDILDKPEKIIERLKKLNCQYTSYPYPSNIKFESIQNVKEFAKRLNDSGKKLYDAGLALTYHNHQIEFQRINNKPILEILFEETNPRYLQAEIDTYWVQYGGGNPVDWCQRLKNRLPLLHMKDFKITKENTPYFAEIGNGNLDWKNILSASEKSGCQWYIVEQDICPGDPFDSLKKSFDNIKENLCS